MQAIFHFLLFVACLAVSHHKALENWRRLNPDEARHGISPNIGELELPIYQVDLNQLFGFYHTRQSLHNIWQEYLNSQKNRKREQNENKEISKKIKDAAEDIVSQEETQLKRVYENLEKQDEDIQDFKHSDNQNKDQQLEDTQQINEQEELTIGDLEYQINDMQESIQSDNQRSDQQLEETRQFIEQEKQTALEMEHKENHMQEHQQSDFQNRGQQVDESQQITEQEKQTAVEMEHENSFMQKHWHSEDQNSDQKLEETQEINQPEGQSFNDEKRIADNLQKYSTNDNNIDQQIKSESVQINDDQQNVEEQDQPIVEPQIERQQTFEEVSKEAQENQPNEQLEQQVSEESHTSVNIKFPSAVAPSHINHKNSKMVKSFIDYDNGNLIFEWDPLNLLNIKNSFIEKCKRILKCLVPTQRGFHFKLFQITQNKKESLPFEVDENLGILSLDLSTIQPKPKQIIRVEIWNRHKLVRADFDLFFE